MPNIILGITGSVAAIKAKELTSSLKEIGKVKIVVTKSSKYFLRQEDFVGEDLYLDEHEWPENPKFKLGDTVLHIELRKWADVLVIAPLSANTMAKIRYGFCDNLLTCIARAWDEKKPKVIVPAMNTCMWENNLTKEQLSSLKDANWTVVDPVEKLLACGDKGMGAMAPIDSIATCVASLITN